MPHARVTVAVTQTPLSSVPSVPSDSGQASSAEALATDIAGLEVDAGVGGKAAVEVGRRLARLARTA